MNALETITTFLDGWKNKSVSAMEITCDPLWKSAVNRKMLLDKTPSSSDVLTMTYLSDPITGYMVIREMNPYPAYVIMKGKRYKLDPTMIRDFLLRLFFKSHPEGLRFKMRVVFSKAANEFRINPESIGRDTTFD